LRRALSRALTGPSPSLTTCWTELIAIRLCLQRAAAGQLRDQKAPGVAHQLRLDVLVGGGSLCDCVNVHAAFVSEGAFAHVGLIGLEGCIRALVHEAGELRELREVFGAAASKAHLENEVGDDGAKVGIPAALAKAVDGALDVGGAGFYGGEGVGSREAGVVVSVDAERDREFRRDFGNCGADFRREAASVGVAQTEAVRSPFRGGFKGLHCVNAIGLEAVEEVLRVEVHFQPLFLEVADGLFDHAEVLLK